MTVQLIANRAQTQTSATTVAKTSSQQGASVEAAFLSALQTSLSFVPGSMVPSVANALKDNFQAPQPSQTTTQASTLSQAPQSQDNQSAPTNNSSTDDQSQPAPQAAPTAVHQDNGKPAPTAKSNTTKAAKSDDDAPAKPKNDDQAINDALQQQVAAIQQQIVPQAQTAVVETTAPQVEQAAAPTQQIEIAPEQVAGPVETTQPEAIDTDAKPTVDPGAKFSDLLAGKAVKTATAAAAAAATGPAVETAATTDTATAAAATGPAVGQHDVGDLVKMQQNDLSQRLGTNADAVKVSVQVTQSGAQSGPQFGAQANQQTDGTLVAQAADPVMVVQTQPAETEGKSFGGEQGDAARALTSDIAQGPAPAAQAADTAFAAALAAQADADQQAAAPQAQTAEAAQPVVGIGSTQGTQATQKTTGTQAAQTPQAPRQAEQQEVVDQIKVQIAKQAKDGNDTIKIQLKPLDLGRIEIKLEVGHGGQVQATVTADNKDTLAMLQKDSSGLTKALNDAGLKTDSGSLSFNLRSEQQQQQQAGDNSGGQSRGGRRSRLLAGIDASASSTQSPAAGYTGRAGVNISV